MLCFWACLFVFCITSHILNLFFDRILFRGWSWPRKDVSRFWWHRRSGCGFWVVRILLRLSCVPRVAALFSVQFWELWSLHSFSFISEFARAETNATAVSGGSCGTFFVWRTSTWTTADSFVQCGTSPSRRWTPTTRRCWSRWWTRTMEWSTDVSRWTASTVRLLRRTGQPVPMLQYDAIRYDIDIECCGVLVYCSD